MRGFALAAALLFGGIPLAAAPAALPETTAATHRQKALVLAQTVQSTDVAVDGAMAGLDKQFVDAVLANEAVRKLENAHPGAVRAMWEGSKPLMRQQLIKALPSLWNLLADVYAAHFTDAQIEALTAFFRSPTGHKFLLEMNNRVDVRPMVGEAVSGQGKVAQQTYVNSATSASVNAYSAMSEKERAEINALMASETGRALATVAPEVARVGVQWMNDQSHRDDAAMEAAMTAALQRFLREHP